MVMVVLKNSKTRKTPKSSFCERPSVTLSFFSPLSVPARIFTAHVMRFSVKGDICHIERVLNSGPGV
ncbi:hypothetical protein ACVW19_005665 [Streptomyces sp. TE5632]